MIRHYGLKTLQGEWHALLPRYMLLAERVTGRRVLDVGCGSGLGASLLLEMGAVRVDAIDHRPAVLDSAKRLYERDGLHFNVMFWEELAFPDNTFDMVVCLDPASPITDPSLLHEIKRVLKHDGEYVCAVQKQTSLGLEALLPRYGYVNPGVHIDFYNTQGKVPQVGGIQRFFPSIQVISQQPRLSYVFTAPGHDELQSGIDYDARYIEPDQEMGAIELWFCANALMECAPEKIVQMPFNALVSKLIDLNQRMQDDRVGSFTRALSHAHTEADDRLYSASTPEPPARYYSSTPSEQTLNEDVDLDFIESLDQQFDASMFIDEPTVTFERSLQADPAETPQPARNVVSTSADSRQDDFAHEEFAPKQKDYGHLNEIDETSDPSDESLLDPYRQDDFAMSMLETTNPSIPHLNQMPATKSSSHAHLESELENLKELFDGLAQVVSRQTALLQRIFEQYTPPTEYIEESPYDDSQNHQYAEEALSNDLEEEEVGPTLVEKTTLDASGPTIRPNAFASPDVFENSLREGVAAFATETEVTHQVHHIEELKDLPPDPNGDLEELPPPEPTPETSLIDPLASDSPDDSLLNSIDDLFLEQDDLFDSESSYGESSVAENSASSLILQDIAENSASSLILQDIAIDVEIEDSNIDPNNIEILPPYDDDLLGLTPMHKDENE